MKKFVLCVGMMLVTAVSFADDEKGLVIDTNAGKQEIVLNNILSIKYQDETMVINLRNGEQATIAIDDVKTITFAMVSPTALREIVGSNAKTITITDVQGRQVWKGKMGDEMPNLRGLYVVEAGDVKQKVIIK